jgi:hypothetical protein
LIGFKVTMSLIGMAAYGGLMYAVHQARGDDDFWGHLGLIALAIYIGYVWLFL